MLIVCSFLVVFPLTAIGQGTGCHGDGWFGEKCSSSCNCFNRTESCDQVTGHCAVSGCAVGWKGSDCFQECNPGRFGMKCSKKCQCKDKTEICDHEHGSCKSGCANGWTGSDCQIECPDGHFGEYCISTCHCMDPDEVCDKRRGVCRSVCAPGWTNYDCQTECPDGYYGEECSRECHCESAEEVCDKMTGYCLTGCAGNWTGPACENLASAGLYTSLPVAVMSIAIAIAVTALFVSLGATCYFLSRPIRRKRDREHRSPRRTLSHLRRQQRTRRNQRSPEQNICQSDSPMWCVGTGEDMETGSAHHNNAGPSTVHYHPVGRIAHTPNAQLGSDYEVIPLPVRLPSYQEATSKHDIGHGRPKTHQSHSHSHEIASSGHI